MIQSDQTGTKRPAIAGDVSSARGPADHRTSESRTATGVRLPRPRRCAARAYLHGFLIVVEGLGRDAVDSVVAEPFDLARATRTSFAARELHGVADQAAACPLLDRLAAHAELPAGAPRRR